MKPRLFVARDEREEANFIAQKIADLRRNGTDLQNIAVLFRSGFHSYKLELELNAGAVDFEKRGGLKLTETRTYEGCDCFLASTG